MLCVAHFIALPCDREHISRCMPVAAHARRYMSYAKTLTSRVNSINGRTYASDPTIFAWDLLNEARCQGCAPYTISVSYLPMHG